MRARVAIELAFCCRGSRAQGVRCIEGVSSLTDALLPDLICKVGSRSADGEYHGNVVGLASRILRRLPAHVDRVRFAAVCPQWRAATRHGPLPPPLPRLLLSDGTVYSLPGSKPFHFASFMGTGYAGACGDWLVFSGEDGWSLRDPFSNATVTLPPLSRVRARFVGSGGAQIWTRAPHAASTGMITFTRRGRDEGGILKDEDGTQPSLILKKSPPHVCDESVDLATVAWMKMAQRLQLGVEPKKCKLFFCSPNFIVAAIEFTGGEHFAVCRAGATSWWSVHLGKHCPDFIDMAFHQGKLYALDIHDSLYAIEVSIDQSSGNPWISQMQKVINGPCLDMHHFLRGLNRAYLVESHGVLLVVLRQLHHPMDIDMNAVFKVDAAERNEFKVFEADLTHSRWIRMMTISDNEVLFLRRRCSKSVCVSHNALLGDCIFFLDNDDMNSRWYGASSSCSVYSMTDDKVSNPLPTVSWAPGMTFGTWLFPDN